MKTLIVFNHPYEGSYCNAILEAAKNGLAESGQPCDVMHLENDGFNDSLRTCLQSSDSRLCVAIEGCRLTAREVGKCSFIL